MFSDPQSVTYNTVAKSLVAIGGNEDSRQYRLNDSGTIYDLTIGHQFKPARTRVFARLQRTASSADPLVPAQNILASATVTFTMDFPNVGFTPTDNQKLGEALVDWLSDATLLKMINGEV